MLERSAALRIQLVEADEGLRRELARAVARMGFEVVALSRAQAPGQGDEQARFALRVMDLAAEGAAGWLADPSAATRCLFLAGEGGAVGARADGAGRDLDLLAKPFSIQQLEARLLRRLEALRTPEALRQDPLLQTRSPRLARLFERALEVARRDCPISLEGELGTGRRALARALHAASPRCGEALVVLEAPAFGAVAGEPLEHGLRARFASAGAGTLLVVEPEALPARAQAALQGALRSASEGQAPRCITISRTPLDESAREGRLSAELLYRLSGATFRLPPLRERPEDQLAIGTAIGRRVARELGLASPVLEPGWLEGLAREGFPGNRLGLENRLRSALIRGEAAAPGALPRFEAAPPVAAPAAPTLDLRTLERETIVRALGHAKGNRTHASAALGISVRTLRNKIREYGLR